MKRYQQPPIILIAQQKYLHNLPNYTTNLISIRQIPVNTIQ